MNAKNILLCLLGYLPVSAMALTLSQLPLDTNQGGTPLIMLNMERDHKLYYEAYNDASDLDGDFLLDIHFKPTIQYSGYYDSFKCYSYGSGKFTPVEKKAETIIFRDAGCATASAWSGNFLNYLTTSRMDALRRVLYGGKRSTDTATATVLERSYIPQDAHSWGKEYTSTFVDGYDISLYSPLIQPAGGRRHLFANTTLLCPTGNTDPGCTTNLGLPLLRTLTDTSYRVWEWLSIERPVAGVQCASGNNVRANCATGASSTGFTNWEIVPSANFKDLKQETWDKFNCSVHPIDTTSFNGIENCAKSKTGYGNGPAGNISGSGNPFSTTAASQDNYFTLFTGKLVIPTGQGGNYKIGVDGDDAIEVTIDSTVLGWYGGHSKCPTCLDSHATTINLTAGEHTIRYRHEDGVSEDNYYLYWQRPQAVSSIMTDYVVRVDACVTGFLESECRGYPKNSPTVYKPGGILQEFGESNRMAFGLMTGSYTKNESGGVLRKNISTYTDEFNSTNGTFTTTNGIVRTIDKLKIIGFGNDYYYYDNCGVPEVGAALAEGRCRMWGNPTAEIMYEGLRYFAGKSGSSGSTAANDGFAISSTGNDDANLLLPLPTWKDPYKTVAAGGGGYPACSKPSQLVISDITPNFDTDQLPGRFGYSVFPPVAFAGDVAGLNVTTLADYIWANEYGTTKSLFIGQSESDPTNKYDGAPTAKTATSFASIRGLSPEEPTQRGGYYSASIGYFGKTNDVNDATGVQKIDTYGVALASPLPRFVLPVSNGKVTLVPFAKTVGGCGTVTAIKGNYQPTNAIVDYYIDTVANTGAGDRNTNINGGLPYAKFRINYEDSEYGSDHDMDAIAEYELKVKTNGTLDIRTSSNYAAGGCIQHMGYVISGTTTDGIYLEVRDPDTAVDVDYYLDTPNALGSNLPTDTTRNFTAGAIAQAQFVTHDPLWYAAKWGGFVDSNNDNLLTDSDTFKEWDNRNGINGVPDTYFLVTNANDLKTQLEKAFIEILDRDSSSSAAATNSTSLETTSRVYQAKYNSLDWTGQLLSFKLSKTGTLSNKPEWDAGSIINSQDSLTGRVMITKGASDGVPFNYAALTGPTATAGTQQNLLDKNISGTTDNCGVERIAYLRGDATHEDPNGTFTCASGATINNFRERITSKLGDIVSSTPLFVGPPAAGLSDTDNPGYSAFATTNATRKPVLYAGANDGMLHGFDASIDVSTDVTGVPTPTTGKEVLAYLPSVVFPNLSKLTDQNYSANHLYFVDDSPMSSDIDIGTTSNDWRTVLVGSMGAGGKGYYALDITNPTNYTEGNAANIVLWEFNDIDMGFAFNRPPTNAQTGQARQFVKLKVGGITKWAVIVGNGYNSPNGKAVLYVVFIEAGIDGTWGASDYVKIVADSPTGLNNGLSTPMPIDTNSDGFVDTVYAGDLKGNMWKFLIGEVLDASGNPTNGVTSVASTWKVGFSSTTCGSVTPSTCVPLFKAINSAGQSQPIFWPPELTVHPNGGQLVFFGTGKYIETADSTNADIQTFYGIWDRNDGTTIGTRAADLLQQSFSDTACATNPPTAGVACTFTSTAGGTFRIPTAKPINWRPALPAAFVPANCTGTCTPTHMGWYIDLPSSRERATGIPKLVSKIIFFNTLIPPNTTCSPATGWLASLDYLTGGLFNRRIYDTNGNSKITSDDYFAGAAQVGAVIGGSTIIKGKGVTTPAPVDNAGTGTIGSGTGDTTEIGAGEGVAINSASDGTLSTTRLGLYGSSGRMSWRELTP